MTIKLAILVSSLLLAVVPLQAAEKTFPERISGVWVGDGSIYRSSGAPRERVRCRFSSKWAKKESSVSLRYICLGIDIKFETTGTLKWSEAGQTIAGKLTTVGIGRFKASGKRKGKNIVMRLDGKDKKTGKPVSGTLTISLNSEKSLRSALSATDPKTGKRFQVFKASFKR